MDHEDISTARLRLRILRADDAAWIAKEIAKPEVHRWLTSPPAPYTRADAEAFIATFQGDPGYRVIEKDRRPLGVISIGDLNGEPGELGYWLMENDWGRGTMSEAARAMVAWHWQRSSAALVSGWIVGNAGSAQILSQLGFTPTTRVDRHVYFYGAPRAVERVRLAAPYTPLFTCRTERLILNALTPEDLALVHHQFGRPEVARMVSTIMPNWTEGEARTWLYGRITGDRTGFGRAIRLRDGTLIGSVGMGGPSQNVGYLLDPAHWGQGYMTEALRAFLPAAAAHWRDIDTVEATVFDDNPGSAKLLEKLGFRVAGHREEQGLGRAAPSPITVYHLSAAALKRLGHAS